MKKLLLLPILFASLLIVGCSQAPVEQETVEETVIESVERGTTVSSVEQVPQNLVVKARFTQDFIENWRYEESCGYYFAVRVDVKGNGDLKFYDVFRNENNGVSNSREHGLSGAVPSCQFTDWVTRQIPLSGDVVWSKKSGEYGFTYGELGQINEKTRIGISGLKQDKEDFYELDWYVK